MMGCEAGEIRDSGWNLKVTPVSCRHETVTAQQIGDERMNSQ